MNNAQVRTAIAEAIGTVQPIRGYRVRPAVPRPGDAWPQWRGSERGDGFFVNAWAVLIVLPPDEETADEWADLYGDALADALQPVFFVDSFAPSVMKLDNEDALALLITGRVE